MVLLSDEAFDDAVSDALDAVPAPLLALLDNVVFLTAEEPPDHASGVVGLYEGIPLTERGWGTAGTLPDRITIFRGPLRRSCTDISELRHQITVTVVHEIAHHFGIGDARLDELGWG